MKNEKNVPRTLLPSKSKGLSLVTDGLTIFKGKAQCRHQYKCKSQVLALPEPLKHPEASGTIKQDQKGKKRV